MRTPVLTAVCIGMLAFMTHAAQGLDDSPECGDLCSKEFWAVATGDDVAAEFIRHARALSYRGNILRLAITSDGRADAVKELLDAGAPPNARLKDYPWDDYGNRSVLQEAARRDARLVSVLLNAGALPHMADQGGRTPLHDAVEAGLTGVVTLLVKAGADRRAMDAKGVTPMDLAERLDDDAMRFLLRTLRAPPPCGRLCAPEFWRTATREQVAEALARGTHTRERSRQGDASLHVALAEGADVEMVKLLLDHGADPNARNARDDTPLHVAARTPGATAAVGALLQRGAMLEAANGEDRTPLHVASERADSIGAMRLLLDAGANPNVSTGDYYGDTAWSLVVRQSEGPEATRLLLERGHSAFALADTVELLFAAVVSGHLDTVTLLLDQGIQPNDRNGSGHTPLFYAARRGNLAMMRVLLARGADANMVATRKRVGGEGDGTTALHHAVKQPAAIELLLRSGADPEKRFYGMAAALHLAARYCQGASLGALLDGGADPNALNYHGETPLGWVVWTMHESKKSAPTPESKGSEACREVVTALVRQGANPYIPDSKGVTPLDAARQYGLDNTVIQLLEKARQRRYPFEQLLNFRSRSRYHRCGWPCSEESWAGKSVEDVWGHGTWYRRHILRRAFLSGASADVVRELLRYGAPPNARLERLVRKDAGFRYAEGPYVLQEAARRDAKLVSVLLDAGALPHLGDAEGRTPLHEAAEAGLPDAVTLLLAAGADPRTADMKGVTAVDVARRLGNDEMLALLSSPPPPRPCGILCQPQFWSTATTGEIREALAMGANARGRSPRGDSPLHIALAAGAGLEHVKLLLDHGADPNARNARDDTPLHVAARTPGGAAAIPVLLQWGAIRDAANAEDWTPLHVASERAATIDAMRALLDAGASPHIRAGDYFGETPRSLAAKQHEGSHAIALLSEYGGDNGDLLPHAAERGHPETVELLLDQDAPRGYRSSTDPPIFDAARGANAATMRVLLMRGADPNKRANLGWETPLHLAARDCSGATLGLLLAQGVEPNVRDRYGYTPLSNAVAPIIHYRQEVRSQPVNAWIASCSENENREVCEARLRRELLEWKYEEGQPCEGNIIELVRHGASPNVPDHQGLTPLDKAKKRNLGNDIIQVLENPRRLDLPPKP